MLAYYERQMSEHGWNVNPVHGEPEVGENSPTQYLDGYREGYRYRIMSDRAVNGHDPHLYVEVSGL